MAATIEFCESNGAGETITHGVANWNFGSTDAPNVIPASFPITAGTNSFTKFWRFHVSDMASSNKIDNLQCWKSAGAYVTGEDIQCSLTTTEGTYDATPYATPTQTTYTAATFPTADPGTANWGIKATLSGYLTVTGYSDYLKAQMATTGSTPPGNVNQKTFTINYDEQ